MTKSQQNSFNLFAIDIWEKRNDKEIFNSAIAYNWLTNQRKITNLHLVLKYFDFYQHQ